MKSTGIFNILAAGLLVMAACTEEENPISTFEGGLDSSKPTVTNVAYDAAGSGAKAVTVSWNADKALAAGATSFTFELCLDKEVKDVTNASVFKVINAPETAGTISGLAEGDYYYARVRANYDGLLYSEWAYMPDGICVGKGVVEIVFAAPANLTAKPTDISFEATWDKVPFAVSYTFGYKEASASEWTDFKDIKATKYEVVGLTENTTYDIRVKAFKGEESTDYATATITTKEASKFNPNITTADQFVEFMTTEAPAASAAATYTLGADIDLSGKTVPVLEEFKGSLNGQNHVIKNLSISAPLITVLKGNVSNIVIDESCTVNAAGSFAILAGTNQGTIDGVVNKASFTDACAAGATEGVAIAAIAEVSTGSVKNCKNEGNITVTCDGILASPVVAGVVAYQKEGSFENNSNTGKISVSHNGTSCVTVEGFDRKPYCVMSGVLGLLVNSTMSGCENSGEVIVSCSAEGKIGARHYVGGILGTPERLSTIRNCTNNGAVTVDFSNDATGKQVWVAGIAGGRNADFKECDGVKLVENCVNTGVITLKSDYVGANNYVAGIGGQASIEAPGDLTGEDKTLGVLKNCTNKGKIVTAGALQPRAGGISGGACSLDGCKNEGELEIGHCGSKMGYVGGLIAYPTQAHTVVNSRNTGKITVLETANKTNFPVGGMFGQCGNTNQSYEGNSVNCVITTPSVVKPGIVLGTASSLAAGKTITLGTASAPFKVSGTINGTALTASNFADYIAGDGAKTAGGDLILNVQYGE